MIEAAAGLARLATRAMPFGSSTARTSAVRTGAQALASQAGRRGISFQTPGQQNVAPVNNKTHVLAWRSLVTGLPTFSNSPLKFQEQQKFCDLTGAKTVPQDLSPRMVREIIFHRQEAIKKETMSTQWKETFKGMSQDAWLRKWGATPGSDYGQV